MDARSTFTAAKQQRFRDRRHTSFLNLVRDFATNQRTKPVATGDARHA
jgi:hypothetical protein